MGKARGSIRDGFQAVAGLDNANVYGVILSEIVSNIFKEGMWFKALTPYMLILSGNDNLAVGNLLTLNGITRALVGVFSGRVMINSLGAENMWVMTGLIGMLGILVNLLCLCSGSQLAVYILSVVWAVYNGLWNSCLETSWARSIRKGQRVEVNEARQVTNKVSTSLGPLLGAAIFLWCGDTWDVEVVQRVMLLGTVMTAPTVLLCFSFRTSAEIEQDVLLRDVRSIAFPVPAPAAPPPAGGRPGTLSLRCADLRKGDFEAVATGNVVVTYPLGGSQGMPKKWHSRVQIVTRGLEETDFILVKQYRATFKHTSQHDDTCALEFQDSSRKPAIVRLKSAQVFFMQDRERTVNRDKSKLYFSLCDTRRAGTRPWSAVDVLSSLACGDWGRTNDCNATCALEETLLAESGQEVPAPSEEGGRAGADPARERRYNLLGANVIVACDVLNALGAGFSLKFIDLFLKVDYGVSPAGVFAVGFLQNIVCVALTPVAKRLVGLARELGFRPELVVVSFWSCALAFLCCLCVPGMPLWAIVPSIVLMQAANACTKAYNRAQLVDYLSPDKIPKYMAWDALNKANQGGIACVGGVVVAMGGYRACFLCTAAVFLVRIAIFLAYILRKGTIRRKCALADKDTVSANLEKCADYEANYESFQGSCADNAESQMFSPQIGTNTELEVQVEEGDDVADEMGDGSPFASLRTPVGERNNIW